MHPKLCSPTTSRLFQGFFFFFSYWRHHSGREKNLSSPPTAGPSQQAESEGFPDHMIKRMLILWLWMGLRHLFLTLSTLGKCWEGTAAKLLHLDSVLGKKHRLLQEGTERIHKGRGWSGFVIWPWKSERETVLHNHETAKKPWAN